jgi:hypothetical protein
MIKAIRKSIEIFGKENFRVWLSTPNYAMGGFMPTYWDWDVIYNELVNIEFGALA